MNSRPLFTVIIPTLNRANTLRESLRTVALQDFDRMEIVVSDNCSTDNTKDIVEELKRDLPMLRYVCPERRLSMSSHWEFAFSHAHGQYVTYVGDDDGIMLGGLNLASEIIEEHNQPSALNSVNVEYHWPDSPIPFHQSLIRYPTDQNKIQTRSSSPMLDLIRRNLRLYIELPMLYRGFVRLDVLRGLADRTNGLFKSSIPDVYAAIAIASVTEDYLFTTTPLFIEGVSGASNGAKMASKDCDSDKSFFVDDGIPFHAEVNYCASPSYLQAESLLQCRDAGILDNTQMMSAVDLISVAALWSQGLNKERYSQTWSAITRTAHIHGLLSFKEGLQEKYPNTPHVTDPFPNETFWVDSRNVYEPALSIRADRFGCTSVADCAIFLSSGAARIEEAKLNQHSESAICSLSHDFILDTRLTASRLNILSRKIPIPAATLGQKTSEIFFTAAQRLEEMKNRLEQSEIEIQLMAKKLEQEREKSLVLRNDLKRIRAERNEISRKPHGLKKSWNKLRNLASRK